MRIVERGIVAGGLPGFRADRDDDHDNDHDDDHDDDHDGG